MGEDSALLMETCLIAATTASLAITTPALPKEGPTVSVRPLFCVLAAQGGAYWLFPEQRDKQYHAMGCALVSSVVTELTGSPWWGIASGIGVGLVKEVIDPSINGTRDYQDFGADLLGAGMGTLLYLQF